MTPQAATVVIVSYQRPAHLSACVQKVLAQGPGAVIVVADPSGMSALDTLPDAPVRRIPFAERNISAARNLGLAQVATPLVVFIDDDSRPEPGWLAALCAAFAAQDVIAATGPVRTGDTNRWQFRGEQIDRQARLRALNLPDGPMRCFEAQENSTMVTIGTNCAFRVNLLCQIGGFDQKFRYYLDESDLNMRLMRFQAKTAFVPNAQVRHYRAAGPYRRADGQLKDRSEVGASLVRFLQRHGDPARFEKDLEAAFEVENRRMLRGMQRGDLEPRDVLRGRAQLRCGAEKALSSSSF